MAGRYILLSVCFAFILSNVLSIETVNGRIKLTIGTSSGCGNSANFIRNHLVGSYLVYHEFLDVEFVPWGRTIRNADGSMTCQFGANDCWANRLHRCVLNYLGESTMDKVRYMSCEFTAPFPAFARRSFDCAIAAGWNETEAAHCVDHSELDTLDEDAQAAAAEPMRIINWVPFVLFNDVLDVQNHWGAHSNLRSMLCEALINDMTIPIRSCPISNGAA